MLRGENIVCGLASGGTGDLTLSAAPSSVGALDFRQWSTALNGFTTGKTLLLPYTLIEYTDSTFETPSQVETGIGTIVLAGTIGAMTIERTTVLTTQTGSTYDESAATALNIGTAANTLIFIGVNAWGVPAFTPYLDQSLDTTYGVGGLASGAPGLLTPNSEGATGNDTYALIIIPRPVFAKVARIEVETAYSGTTGTPISAAYASLYQLDPNGKPGHLLVDFGSFGTNPLNGTGVKAATAGTGMLIPPGEYWQRIFLTWSGATGTVTQAKLRAYTPVRAALQFVTTTARAQKKATGGAAGAAPDPANVASWANTAGGTGLIFLMGFAAA